MSVSITGPRRRCDLYTVLHSVQGHDEGLSQLQRRAVRQNLHHHQTTDDSPAYCNSISLFVCLCTNTLRAQQNAPKWLK